MSRLATCRSQIKGRISHSAEVLAGQIQHTLQGLLHIRCEHPMSGHTQTAVKSVTWNAVSVPLAYVHAHLQFGACRLSGRCLWKLGDSCR